MKYLKTIAFLTGAFIAGGAQAFEAQGHRGARWWRPENTLSAFQYALDAGVDTLELDLHVTKDDVLVLGHDPHINPTLCLDEKGQRITRDILIRDLTIKEVQAFDCGSLINPRFPTQVPQPKERMPTFEEFLTWLAKHPNPLARTVLLNVETKIEPAHPTHAPTPRRFVELVAESVRRHRLEKRMVLQSFDFRTLEEARKLMPKVQRSALLDERPKEDLVAVAQRLKAAIISPNAEWLKKEDVDHLHQARVRVIPWTANTKEQWQALVAMGVDGIISDDASGLVDFKKSLTEKKK